MALPATLPANLTELQRRVVRLRDAEGLTWAEIGRQLGMDPGNAQTAYTRAQAKMLQAGPPPPLRSYRRLVTRLWRRFGERLTTRF